MYSNRQAQLTWWITLVVSVALIWIANDFGFWWVSAIVGLLIGILGLGMMPRPRYHAAPNPGAGASATCALLAGLLGWVLPLFWRWLHAPVWQTANTVSGVMGFGVTSGWIVWVMTAVIGLLLALAPCWLGLALRRLVA